MQPLLVLTGPMTSLPPESWDIFGHGKEVIVAFDICGFVAQSSSCLSQSQMIASKMTIKVQLNEESTNFTLTAFRS